MSGDSVYLGNPNLKKANVQQTWTKEEVGEYAKCMKDPIYFIQQYIKIVSLDEGLIPFKLYDFQKEMVGTFHNNRFTICKLPRQSGKSTTIIAYLLHYVLFNPSVNVAILANKAATARDLLGRLQLAYENLPKWLQQGVMSWNKGSLELENGSKILASSTSASAVRGGSYNIIFLDEFAYVPANVAEQFFSSVYPTISSGKTTKVMIVSTPHGMNMFYKLWNDAENERNSYIPIEVHWSEIPGRDVAWKEETIKNTSVSQFNTEFECEFLGSIDTLITPQKLRTMSYKNPTQSNAGIDLYEKPEPGRTYVLVADVSRGTKNDYSAFLIFDVSEMPYRIAAKYRDNEIKPLLFPSKIYDVARAYNQAFVTIEVNDIGEQVASALQYDLEYDNLVMASMRGRAGQILGGGFSGGRAQLGVRTTKAVKKIGCSNLKQLIEDNKLIIEDLDIISELSTFIVKGSSYEADDGCTDDLVACMFIFAWMTDQTYFKELTDMDIRQTMMREQQDALEQDMAPFGFVVTGLEDENIGEIVDEYGTRWNP
ncbi:MAG: terminase family protein, partial [Candidatus Pacebacteria bacterium]|nr:terminase family protein [Candidatus Paceibacterota bacterium]